MSNSIDDQEKQALIEEINDAFDGVSRENGVSLSESWVIDNRGTPEERLEARQQDTETCWQDVPDDEIGNGYSCLSFMDGVGFRYYLPAYMTWFLRHSDDPVLLSSSDTFDSLLYNLQGGTYSVVDEFYLEKFRLFSPEQSRAIGHFLVWEAAYEDEKYCQELLAVAAENGGEDDLDLPETLPSEYEANWPQNAARRALEKYWCQFL